MYIKERRNEVARDKRDTNRPRYKPEVTHPATECQKQGNKQTEAYSPHSLQQLTIGCRKRLSGAAATKRGRHRNRRGHLRHTSGDEMLMNSQARLCINIGTNERKGERHPIGLIDWAPLPHQSSISQMEPTANALATNVLFLSTHHHPQRTNQRDGPTAGVKHPAENKDL